MLYEGGQAQWCAQSAGSCFAFSAGADGAIRLWDAMAAGSSRQPLIELPSLGRLESGVNAQVRSMHLWTSEASDRDIQLVCGLEDGTCVQWAVGQA